jgi:hypothetical protein
LKHCTLELVQLNITEPNCRNRYAYEKENKQIQTMGYTTTFIQQYAFIE